MNITTAVDQGEQGRMDLLTVVMHEMGLGLGLSDGGSGIMQMELPTGTRPLPSADAVAIHSVRPAISTAPVPLAPASALLPPSQTLSGSFSPASADLLFALLSEQQGHRKASY